MKQSWKRIASLLLSVCMVLTLLPTAVFAEDEVKDSGAPIGVSGTITAFAKLTESVAARQVEIGTQEDELSLPDLLTVTVTVSDDATATDSEVQEEETQEMKTTVSVSGWTSAPPYDGDAKGDYIFTPEFELPDGLTVAEGVALPQTIVTVGASMKKGSAVRGETSSEADFEFWGDGVLRGYTGTDEVVTIPESIGSTTVTTLGDGASTGALTPITRPNGTEKSIAALGLPLSAVLNLSNGSTAKAPITWDLSSFTYDPSQKSMQVFVAEGSILSLPEGTENRDDVNMTVYVSVTVSADSSLIPPSITTTSLPGGLVHTPYSQTLTAEGSTPITWSMTGYTPLPNGLTLSEQGVIFGTPTMSGTFLFSVWAENAGGHITKELSISINPVGYGEDGLTISVTDSADAVPAGVIQDYTTVVANEGSTEIEAVVFYTLSEQTAVSSWTVAHKDGGGDVVSGWPESGTLSHGTPIEKQQLTLVTLPAGSSVTFTLSVSIRPNAAGELTVSVEADKQGWMPYTKAAADTNELFKKADLTVTIDDGKTTLAPSEAAPYKIRVTNNGPSNVSDVALSCLLPAGAELANWGPNGYYSGALASPISGSGALNTTLVLNSGAYYEFWFTVLTPATASGSLVATATVTAPVDVSESNESNNAATDTNTFANSSNADLELSMGFGNQTGNETGEVTFYAKIFLKTSGNATNVVVSVPLPSGVTFVSATPDMGTYDASSGDWSVGTLSEYGSVYLEIKARVDYSAPRTVTASLKSLDQTEDDLANNSASLDVSQRANLAVTAAADHSAPKVGGTVTITVTLKNEGPNTAKEFIMRMTLPTGHDYVSSTPSLGTYFPPGDGYPYGDWYPDLLNSGETATLQIKAKVTAPGTYTFRAQIRGLEILDPDTTNNSASVTITADTPVGTAPTITTTLLPNGTVNASYSQTLAADGDTPITWSIDSGALPNGLTLNAVTGEISGTPTVSDTFSFTAKAVNSKGSDTQAFNIMMAPALPPIHTITASAGSGGNISPNGAVSIPEGNNQTFDIAANGNYRIASVTVDGVNQGAISSYTFKNVTGNHTISAAFTYTGGGGGSSGSGSSSGGNTTTTVTPGKIPNQPVTAAAPVTATAGTNGTASANIPDKTITDAIAKAQASARAQGRTANGISVGLNIVIPQGETAQMVTLSQNALQSLVNAGVQNFQINGQIVSLGFNFKALQEIQKQSTGDVTITLAPVQNLSSGARALIGTRPVYNITISYVKSGKTVNITSLGNGSATLSIPYTPRTNEAAGYLFGVYVDGSSNATRILGSTYDLNTKSLVFTATHFSVYGVGYTAPSAKLTDISTHWAKESIDYVVGRGLFSGTSETTFAPNTAMTRGMLVTALGRLAGMDTKAFTKNTFTDVKADSAFRPYSEWAYSEGIVQGIGNNQFAPDRAVTREEIAVIFTNYAKATSYKLPVTREATTYADVSSIGTVYKTAVTAMQQAGIMMGEQNNKFNPKANATRAEVSAMLHRYIKLTIDPTTAQGWAKNDDGQYLYYKNGKALTGMQTIDGVKYYFYSTGVFKPLGEGRR